MMYNKLMDRRYKYHIDPTELKSLFIDHNWTRARVAQHFGVSERYIKFFCGKHNIHKSVKKVQENIVATNLKKYGAARPMQTETGRANFVKSINAKHLKTYNERRKWSEEFKKKHGRRPTPQEVAREFDLSVGAIYQSKFRGHDSGASSWASYYETFVEEVLRSLGAHYEKHVRAIISPLEVDFFLPELQLAFEVDDVWSHNSDVGPAKNPPKKYSYHLNKTSQCEQLGIQLIHFTSWEILNKPETVKNRVRALCAKNSSKVYARKCACQQVAKKDYRQFLEINHMDGACASTYTYGLFNNKELVAVAGFSKPRYKSRGADWELVRFAAKHDVTVVGGISKLITAFQKNYGGSILSYSDRAYSNGNVYRQIGFKHVGITKPNYAWYSLDSKQKISNLYLNRVGFDKIFGTDYGKGTSNTQLMREAGYVRMFDCGNDVWIKAPLNAHKGEAIL